MSSKYQRPAGAYAGGTGLANRTKYQDDANAVPKRAVSSAKVDGDVNYILDSLNQIDEASGSRASIDERLNVSLNADGTLKVSVAGAMDEWIVHVNAGAIARVDNSTFSMAGDWRSIYQLNRRVKVTVGGIGLTGDVADVTYSGGLTVVECVDLLDTNGLLDLISSAPTQIAYGPLTAGVRGNTPQRFDSVRIPAGLDTYELTAVGGNLGFLRNGVGLAQLGAAGFSGLMPASVESMHLNADLQSKLVPAGSVMPFAGATVPTGWLMCFGQAVSRTTYSGLFGVLGSTYGAGDGTTTFNLPDLRGRAVLGLDNMGGTDAGRLSTANTLGGTGGAQLKTSSTAAYTLTVADIPAHTHVEVANSALDFVGASGTGTSVAGQTNGSYSGGTSNQVLTRSTGGGGGHSHAISNFDVLPPYILLNHIIKT